MKTKRPRPESVNPPSTYKKTELWAILRDLEMGKIGVKYAYDKISRLI